MKRFTFGTLVLLGFTACSPKVYQSLDWQSKVVVADGKIDEWPNPLRFYDDKSKVNYTITNDNNNLYICMKVVSPETQIKIVRGGVELKIDTLGNTKYPISFNYPIAGQPATFEMDKRDGEEQGAARPKREELKNRMVEQAQEAELVGFKNHLNGIINLHKNQYGIAACIEFDKSGVLFYEAIIPFKTFYKDALSKSDINKVYAFQIKLNAINSTSKHGGSTGGEIGNRYSGGRGMYEREMEHRAGGLGGGMHRNGIPSEGFAGGGADMNNPNKIEMVMKLSVH